MKTQKLANGAARIDTASYLLELRPKEALVHLDQENIENAYQFGIRTHGDFKLECQIGIGI